MGRPFRLVIAMAVLAGPWALASCGRVGTLEGRLAAVRDERAREALREALWTAGGLYRWAEVEAMRLDVERTEHRPEGDRTRRERWTLEPGRGRLRLEVPERREVVVFDGATWRAFVDGRETEHLGALGEAAGRIRLAREIATMPFGLLGPGRTITYLDRAVGPGGTRAWDRLLVAYGPESGALAGGGRTLVEVRTEPAEATAAVVRWAEWPFLGRTFRIELDDRRPAGELALARHWRILPADERGRATGPARWTYRVREIVGDVPTTAATFRRP